jgi:hypothetical protein
MPMHDGTIRGEWEHQDHGSNSKGHGQAVYLVCRNVADLPGPSQPGGKKGFDINQVYFGGPARWFTGGQGWADGYWFDVMAEDHGEPGNTSAMKSGPKGSGVPDYYHYTIRQMQGPNSSGPIVYEATRTALGGGNIQIHPPNAGHPYTPSQLPSWVSLEE